MQMLASCYINPPVLVANSEQIRTVKSFLGAYPVFLEGQQFVRKCWVKGLAQTCSIIIVLACFSEAFNRWLEIIYFFLATTVLTLKRLQLCATITCNAAAQFTWIGYFLLSTSDMSHSFNTLWPRCSGWSGGGKNATHFFSLNALLFASWDPSW